MISKSVLIRVDASKLIGSGHVMRCLTLAEELRKEQADVGFITRKHDGDLNNLIQKKGFKLYDLPSDGEFCQKNKECYKNWLGSTQEVDASGTISILKDLQPDWLIVDHYAIDETWEQRVRPYVKRIMVIDDLADRKHDCDLLLDQNYMSDNHRRYENIVSPACTTLLGPQYALLRQEFVSARDNLRLKDGSVKHVFVFFGGVDSDNMTLKAIKALSSKELSVLFVSVVIGAANPHRKEIAKAVEQRPRTTLHIQVNNIAEIMRQADLALCAGGTTTWERCCIGLPGLVVTIAENQVRLTRYLHMDGLLRWMGTSRTVDVRRMQNELLKACQMPERNRQEALNGMRLVDGHGSKHVSQILLCGPEKESLMVRKAVESDCEMFWDWVNDHEVRKNAFNPEPILWETHEVWFNDKLHDPSATIYVIECEWGSVGQVRFEEKEAYCLISYSLGRQFRGYGIGKAVLKKAIDEFTNTWRGVLQAEVKSGNIASCMNFVKLGFQENFSDKNKVIFRLQMP